MRDKSNSPGRSSPLRQLIGAPSLYARKDEAGERLRTLREEHPDAAESSELMATHTSPVRLSHNTGLTAGQRAAVAAEVARILMEQAEPEPEE